MSIARPYLMFLGDAADQLAAKTAQGVTDWRPDWCVGQFRLPGCKADLKLPDMTLEQAAAVDVKTVIVGVANRGGVIAESWIAVLRRALALGMDLASGLHKRLADVPALAESAKKHGRELFDVRHPMRDFAVGNGKKRAGKRMLTVGTDCSIGKMYTALACEQEMRKRGMNADFRATGQTGIMIAGAGMPMDAVVADFEAGAAEMLSPDAAPDHWDVIEGQGSLFHPAYAGVSLGLLHGSQPDVIVLCHDPTRSHMLGFPDYPLPDLKEAIDLTLRLGARTNAAIRCAGVSMNTSRLAEAEAHRVMEQAAAALSLPVADPIRGGRAFEALVRACLEAA